MRRALRGLGVAAVLVFTLFPVWLMVSTALDERANAGSRSLWPQEWTLDNFTFVIGEGGFGRYLMNSLLYLDGASWGRMFWSVLLPLVAPGLVATSVFSFITAWNQFIFALTFMANQDNYTVAVGLRRFFGQYGTDWGAVMAASTLITVPVMVFFVIAQKRLTDGLVAGAVKG
jgi:ABC-type glycerol-3-phosphate transport system permease component